MTDHSTTMPPRIDRSAIMSSDEPVRASIVLLPLRLFLAAGWLRASAEKLVDIEWWRGDSLRKFIHEQQHAALPFFHPVMNSVIAPYAQQVAVVVAVAQLFIGVALLLGRPLRAALWAAIVLNVIFVLCGRVNPSAFYLAMEASLLWAVTVGHLGRGARVPTKRAFVVIGVWLAIAGAMAPFVRTLEPADVIEDPAMMLLFLSLVMAATTFARWLHHHGDRITALTELSVHPVRSWLGCGATSAVTTAVPAAPDHIEVLGVAWREMTGA